MLNLIKHSLQIMLRNKSGIFWTLGFPILLATVYSIVIAPLYEGETTVIDPIHVAIVVEQGNEDTANMYLSIMDEVKQNDETLLHGTIVDETTAKEQYAQESIDGIVYIGEGIHLEVPDKEDASNMIRLYSDSFLQQLTFSKEAIARFGYEQYESVMAKPIQLQFDEILNDDSSPVNLLYYALFGMGALYSSYYGLAAANISEANLSSSGVRVMITPTKKWKVIASNYIGAFLINYAAQLIFFLYLRFALKMEVGVYTFEMLGIVAIAVLAAISWGYVLGVGTSLREEIKEGILAMIPVIGSVFSGMMIPEIRLVIDQYAPIINRINPSNWVTDSLYSLNVYGMNERFIGNVIILIGFLVVGTTLSIVLGRRKNYESI